MGDADTRVSDIFYQTIQQEEEEDEEEEEACKVSFSLNSIPSLYCSQWANNITVFS